MGWFWGRIKTSSQDVTQGVDVTGGHSRVSGHYDYCEYASDPAAGRYVYYGAGGQIIYEAGIWTHYDIHGNEIGRA
jgi:hypothetical protein